MPSKIEKAVAFTLMQVTSYIRPRWSTAIACRFYRRWGLNFTGKPNYISSKVWIDGTDYSLVSIGHEVTISSYIRILTHDWALHTVAKGFDIKQDKPIGRINGITIGDYSFIGTGSILMPGCRIGRCCIIGSGTVARGDIPDYSIVIGSPGQIVGDVRDYLEKKLDMKIERA